MNVGQLIKRLQKCDPKMRVVVDGYEDDYDDPKVVKGRMVADENWDAKNHRKEVSYSGRHYRALDSERERVTKVVVVGR